jgi:hypothetical protein
MESSSEFSLLVPMPCAGVVISVNVSKLGICLEIYANM